MSAKTALTRSKKAKARALMERGQFSEAQPLYERIREIDPSDPEAWHALGWIDNHLGNLESAEKNLAQLVRLRPDEADGHFMLGNVLRELGKIGGAITEFRLAVRYKPDHFQAWANLGNALELVGQDNEAVECFRNGLRLAPGEALLHYNLGQILQRQSKLDDAAQCYRDAIARSPNFTVAYLNLGVLETQRGQYGKAIQHYRQALAIDPQDSEVLNNLGNALKGQVRLEEAVGSYRNAIRMNPRNHTAYSNLLLCLNYLSDIDNATLLREHQSWPTSISVVPINACVEQPDPMRRLRIGYVSPDLHSHSVAFFIVSAMRFHNRECFEVFAYSDTGCPDGITEIIASLVGQWRETRKLSDDQLCEQIRSDRIDILVELTGHTAMNRLRALARKPAPVQVTYLGYPCTTGLPAIDYLITDNWVDPPGSEEYYVEKLVRLPHGFSCYQPPTNAPPVNALPASQPGNVTFSSLNNPVKFNDRVVELWGNILAQLPQSRLILQAKAFAEDETRELYLERFAKHGIARERLELLTFLPPEEHLAVYHRVDIALDPFPWSGHTTSCHALWMGIPVVTLLGKTHAGRMVASALNQIGLPELIAETPDEYLAKVIALANDLPRLADWRATMRERMLASPLCDGPGFTRELEAAYREMWVRYCDQQKQM